MRSQDTDDGNRRREFADLLRSRRDRMKPADVGLPDGSRRRTPGLRREEVAQLASISPTYYAFLEQGRDLRPSRQVLDALARALRLTGAERAHLHELVHGSPAETAGAIEDSIPSALVALVENLDPSPAYVTGRRFDVLASNRAARLLWTDWDALERPHRNIVWWTFADPEARTILCEWDTEAAALLARFRAAAARHPGDRSFIELIERLHAHSAEVRAWWPRHEIAPLSSGTKRLRHAGLGELELDHAVLQLADDPEQKLVAFTAAPADRRRIEQLLGSSPRETSARSAVAGASPR